MIGDLIVTAIGILLSDEPTDYADEMVCRKQGKLVGKRADGSIFCYDKPDPGLADLADIMNRAGKHPKTKRQPTISTPPKIIYKDRIVQIPGDTVYVPTYIPVPDVPTRRLPKQPSFDTASTSTVPGKTITVQYDLNSLEYGTLLHEPISYDLETIRIASESDFAQKFTEKQIKAGNNYIQTIGGQIDTTSSQASQQNNAEIKKTVNDLAVAFVSRHFTSFYPSTTKVTPIFSTSGIAEFINHYLNKNYPDFTPICTVPAEYTIVTYDPSIIHPGQNKLIADILEQLEIKLSNNSSTNLEDIDITTLARRLGVDAFPIEVPSTLIQETDKNNKPIAIPTIQLQSLTEFVVWFFQRWEEATGQWEIPIEIKDTDPSTPGNQSKMLKLPNIAESLATAIELLLQISVSNELNTNIMTRVMVDAGGDKRQNFVTYKTVDAIADYLGFKIKEKQIDLPMMFTPEKEDFAEMLQKCTIPVPVIEFDEKFGLQADLMRFREAAAILKANGFRKLTATSDFAAQIMSILKNYKDLTEETKPSDDDNFDEFLNAVELGFTNTTGVGDATKPYGREYEDRPRIKRIKKVDANDPD